MALTLVTPPATSHSADIHDSLAPGDINGFGPGRCHSVVFWQDCTLAQGAEPALPTSTKGVRDRGKGASRAQWPDLRVEERE